MPQEIEKNKKELKYTHTSAIEAIERLKPEVWATTSAYEKLELLYAIQENLTLYAEDLAKSDADMKNNLLGEELYSLSFSKLTTVLPMANILSACIELYESLAKGEMPKASQTKKVADRLYDLQVFPKNIKDRIMYCGRKDFLRIKGFPSQIKPTKKSSGIIAVLGAGNYSSSIETIKALFLDNCTVVHKPHYINEKTDSLWSEVFKPLVDAHFLSFCLPSQAQELTADPRISKIYFTGTTEATKDIIEASSEVNAELITDCRGNNPCLIVPGDKLWTKREMEYQAMQIASMAKINGGATCGRIQTIITSKHWVQREEFLARLKIALTFDTPASGTYYPNAHENMNTFKEEHTQAEVLSNPNRTYKNADVLFIANLDESAYALQHEAFSQIIDEIALDVPAIARDFLPQASEFCNSKLIGSLAVSILIDEETKKINKDVLEQSIESLNYSAIAVNTMPFFVFLNPYLRWGGNNTDELALRRGDFGNLLCYENVEKSIICSKFMSLGHFINNNITATNKLADKLTDYALNSTWKNFFALAFAVCMSRCKKKDF